LEQVLEVRACADGPLYTFKEFVEFYCEAHAVQMWADALPVSSLFTSSFEQHQILKHGGAYTH